MKKMMVALLFVVAGVVAARAQSNTVLLYGTVGFNSQKAASTTVNSYNVSPGVGYQWNDNWTGGLNLNVSGAKTATDKTSAFSVGPFIRYTQPLSGVFVIYGQLNTNYVSGKAGDTSLSGFGATLFPAIGVDLKNSFALNFTFGALSFTSQKLTGSTNATTNFGVSFGSGVGFGISKNFGLKK